jgi:hypothetical protein
VAITGVARIELGGKQNSEKVEKSTGYWCKNAFPIANIRGFFKSRRIFKSKPKSVRQRLTRIR